MTYASCSFCQPQFDSQLATWLSHGSNIALLPINSHTAWQSQWPLMLVQELGGHWAQAHSFEADPGIAVLSCPCALFDTAEAPLLSSCHPDKPSSISPRFSPLRVYRSTKQWGLPWRMNTQPHFVIFYSFCIFLAPSLTSFILPIRL